MAARSVDACGMAPTCVLLPACPFPRTGTGVTAGGLSDPVGAALLSPAGKEESAGLHA